MGAGEVARVRAWLASEAARALPPSALSGLAALSTASGERLVRRPHGTLVCALPAGNAVRRVLEIDRHGTAVAVLRWTAGGRLETAAIRIPDRSWVTIEPCATLDAPWGLSDRLWHGPAPGAGGDARPLTVFAAVDYAAIASIPPLAEPGRLPAGAGTGVLNLIASLAADQGRAALAYHGPYPTEELFLALHESFRAEPPHGDPLAAFAAGALTWRPAPHERLFGPDALYVQLRDRIDKVVWHGRAYYRADWPGFERQGARRVRDVQGGVRCSLWALGEVLEDHLELTADGSLTAVLQPATPPSPSRSLSRAVSLGLGAAVAAASAESLAPFIREAGAQLSLEWGAVAGDLVAVDGDRVRVSARLRAAAIDRLGMLGSLPERQLLVLAVLQELAAILGDALRARAQSAVLALPVEQQAATLWPPAPGPEPPLAAEIRAAASALLADLTHGAADSSGEGAQDQPDVEREERRDRDG